MSDGEKRDSLPEVAVAHIEQNFPEMIKEFKSIQELQYETFCIKQYAYGPGNISVGTQLKTEEEIKMSLTGLWFRINDKIQRMKSLILKSLNPVGETLEDTLLDMSIYGIIGLIVKRGKWGK